MLSAEETHVSLNGAWRLMLGKADGLRLLDLTADTGTMGKATGKDAAAGKATLVELHGPQWARQQLHGLVGQAQALLEPYGARAALLAAAASFVANRRH